jgi:hypothetical protein
LNAVPRSWPAPVGELGDATDRPGAATSGHAVSALNPLAPRGESSGKTLESAVLNV